MVAHDVLSTGTQHTAHELSRGSRAGAASLRSIGAQVCTTEAVPGVLQLHAACTARTARRGDIVAACRCCLPARRSCTVFPFFFQWKNEKTLRVAAAVAGATERAMMWHTGDGISGLSRKLQTQETINSYLYKFICTSLFVQVYLYKLVCTNTSQNGTSVPLLLQRLTRCQ